MKKRFIFFAALAVFLAIAVTPANAPPKAGGKAVSIIKGPYLQQLTPDSIVIMWETNRAADSRVDYGTTTPPDQFYVQDTTAVKIHEIEISNSEATPLTPNTMYYYTVTSNGVTSDPNTFWTAPATERNFRFVAYGDTRTNKNDHAAVIQAIIASTPEIVLHTGDLVSDGDNKNVWGPEFFTPAYALMINTPLLPIIGNHEGSGNLFRDFFSLGDNDDWFAFSYSNVRFIGLNTHNRSYSPGSTQYTWLEAELQSEACTDADWQIVYFHHPPYSATSSHGDTQGVKDHLVPLFEAHGVDMVFNGHSHAYERYFNNGIYYIVTGGGGAPLASLVEDTKEPIREVGESAYHHCVINVDVDGESLTLWAVKNDGTVLDGPITLPPVDVTPPTASLLAPLDNGPDDLDADDGEVTVNTEQSSFQIQLSDVGDGIDYDTVISAAVTLTEQETGPVDYSFAYDAGLDVITLTPIPADSKFGNGLYAITLSGIADIAGNAMEATLTIKIDTSIVPPVTLSFQQGVGDYIGMVDTMIRWATPTQNYDDSATEHYGGYQYQYNADTSSGGGPCQVLLRFDGIIGDGGGQIPSGSTIVSATLRIRSTDDGNGGKLHRMLVSWVDTFVTWNNFFDGDGIQADDTEAVSVEDHDVPLNNPNTDVDLGVTATVQDWADGLTVNKGWAILPNGSNGWHIAAAEHPTLDYRPELIVTFLTTGNRRPVANAGDDQVVTDDGDDVELVTLDGSASSDPDGTIVSYEWDIDGDQITDYTGETVLDVPLGVGIHTVTLTVEDNEGAADSDDVVITVNPAPDTEPPTAPTDLTATAISTTQIDLNWADNSESDLSHYNVKRSATMEGPYTEIASNVTVSNYSDTGLTASTTYYYVVTAVDTSSNESGNSNEASATTAAPNLKATEPTPSDGQTNINRNTVVLSWMAGAGATSHDVYLGTDSAALAPVSEGQSGTTYDPPRLERKTTYYWRIDEVNVAGTMPGVVWSFKTK